ncbi:MAG: hypothetical protein ABIH04_11605, partial [Planctomycetota bacterium]
ILAEGYRIVPRLRVKGEIAYPRDDYSWPMPYICLADLNGDKEKAIAYWPGSSGLQWSEDGSNLYVHFQGDVWRVEKPTLSGDGVELRGDGPKSCSLLISPLINLTSFKPLPGTEEYFYVLTDPRLRTSVLRRAKRKRVKIDRRISPDDRDNIDSVTRWDVIDYGDGEIILSDASNKAKIWEVAYALKASKIVVSFWDSPLSTLNVYDLEGNLLRSCQIFPSDRPLPYIGNVSEDGKKICYEVVGEEIKADSDIWVLDLETGQKKLLLRGSNPSLSPDGKRVAFLRGTSELWMADIENSTPPECIVKFPKDNNTADKERYWTEHKPRWSPDGRLLVAYLKTTPETRKDMLEMGHKYRTTTIMVDTQNKEIKLIDKELVYCVFRPKGDE